MCILLLSFWKLITYNVFKIKCWYMWTFSNCYLTAIFYRNRDSLPRLKSCEEYIRKKLSGYESYLKNSLSKFNSNSTLRKDGKLYSNKVLSFNLVFFLQKCTIGCNFWQYWLYKDPREEVNTGLSLTSANNFFFMGLT